MPHWKKESFVKDLDSFLNLVVVKYELPVDFSSLYAFQGKIKYNYPEFSINVSDIIFNIDRRIGGTVPHDVSSASIYLDHSCEYDDTKDAATHDKIKKKYLFSMKLVGRSDNNREFSNWWRLDQDEEGDGAHKTTHPYYHFQCGGDELNAIDTGSTLFLSAPRIAHPPMDLFLGFHFIMNNFYSRKMYPFVDQLLSDEDYQDIIIRAQKRLWEPYFNSFNGESRHADFNMGKVFPLFMKIV